MASNSNRKSDSLGSTRRVSASRRPAARRSAQRDRRIQQLENQGSQRTNPNLMPSSRQRDSSNSNSFMKVVLGVGAVILVLILGLVILYNSSLFSIKSVEANTCERIPPTTLGSLAQVPQGATLLNVDTKGIVERLEAYPWISKAEVYREFPSTLKIIVYERQPSAIVDLKGDHGAWYVSNDAAWLSPAALKEGQDINDYAREEGVILVTDVTDVADPVPGEVISNSGAQGAITYITEFSDTLTDHIVKISAPTLDSISFTLDNGVEVAAGEPVQLKLKEQVIVMLLEQHKDEITYINVRVPEQPAWRGLDEAEASNEASQEE